MEKDQQNGPLAEAWQSKRTRQRENKRGVRKEELNDSPGMPDIPILPLRCVKWVFVPVNAPPETVCVKQVDIYKYNSGY